MVNLDPLEGGRVNFGLLYAVLRARWVVAAQSSLEFACWVS